MKVCVNCAAKNDSLASACIGCGKPLFEDGGTGIIPQPPQEIVHRVNMLDIATGVFLGHLMLAVVGFLIWMFFFARHRGY